MSSLISSFFIIAVFSPLAGFLLSGLLGRLIGDKFAQFISILGMVLSSLCAWIVLYLFLSSGMNKESAVVFDWIKAGSFHTSWYLRLDMLSVSMLTMVSSVSLLIHIYSIGYMAHDTMPSYRFFSYLSLFTFSMLMLTSSNNLVELFFGWEGVGLASYLLIGYWYTKPAALHAAIKAFVVNRVADLFFLIGICLLFIQTGSVFYDGIFMGLPRLINLHYHLFGTEFSILEVMAFLLFVGAMGKSAQLFFHVWLPDAMEGPTPVSALIHAATMVTAGVFLMARMSPLIELAVHVKVLILFIGATTAFFAATVALVQPDIKKSIAYSTCSQLGYMFVAIGVGAYQISMFHLTTHAFFKALLFLGAGAVIHALHDEQDMFKMGGLYKKLPITCLLMWVGCLALAGIFPFAGYWSKDAILEAAWMSHTDMGVYAWILTLITAFLTAFYSWRLLFLVFYGKPKEQSLYERATECPSVMRTPLVILAIASILGGVLLAPYYIGIHQGFFWHDSIFNASSNTIMIKIHHTPKIIGFLPLILSFLGIITAYFCYIISPATPKIAAEKMQRIYLFLLNAWYFDKLYQILIIYPYELLSKYLWEAGDKKGVQAIPMGIAKITEGSASSLVRTQTGSVALYAFTMVIGLVVILATFLIHH